MQLWLPRQIDVGCAALASCIVLTCRAPRLSAQAAYVLGAACSLVLGPGRTVLERSTASFAAHRLPLAAALLPQASICQVQVVTATMDRVLSLDRQPQAAAAFANSTAKPAVLLPWLLTVSRALPLVVAEMSQGEQARAFCSAVHMLPSGCSSGLRN